MSRFRANRTKSSSFSLLFSISRVALEVSPSLVEATTRRGCKPGETKTNRRQTLPRAIRTGPARKARVPRPTRARIAEEANRRRSLRFSRRSKADERMQARENAQHSRGTKARKPGIFGPDFSEHRCPPSWSRLTTGVDQRIISRSRFFRVSLSSYLSTYLLISASPSRSRSLPPCLFFACSLCPLGSQFALSLLSLSVYSSYFVFAHRNYNSLFSYIYNIYIIYP